MLDINGVLVSLDLVEKFFCCDLDKCLGQCCIDGDAGAPITEDERAQLERILPQVWDMLLPRAQEEITQNGIAYRDPEGELVTQIVDGRNCVFTCYEPGGLCSCALEKAHREGRIPWCKPISCYLYPARVKHIGDGDVVNYDRWKICRAAETLGRARGLRVYEFLRDPLTRRFGPEWYSTLAATCRLYIATYHPHHP